MMQQTKEPGRCPLNRRSLQLPWNLVPKYYNSHCAPCTIYIIVLIRLHICILQSPPPSTGSGWTVLGPNWQFSLRLSHFSYCPCLPQDSSRHRPDCLQVGELQPRDTGEGANKNYSLILPWPISSLYIVWWVLPQVHPGLVDSDMTTSNPQVIRQFREYKRRDWRR